MAKERWHAVSDLDAPDTTPFALFIALSDAMRFRDQCERDNPNHTFAITYAKRRA